MSGKPVTRFEDATGVHFYGHVRRGEEIAAAILSGSASPGRRRRRSWPSSGEHMLFMNVREMRPNRLKRFLRMPDFPLHLELHRLDCLGSHGLLDNYEFCRAEAEGVFRGGAPSAPASDRQRT